MNFEISAKLFLSTVFSHMEIIKHDTASEYAMFARGSGLTIMSLCNDEDVFKFSDLFNHVVALLYDGASVESIKKEVVI